MPHSFVFVHIYELILLWNYKNIVLECYYAENFINISILTIVSQTSKFFGCVLKYTVKSQH